MEFYIKGNHYVITSHSVDRMGEINRIQNMVVSIGEVLQEIWQLDVIDLLSATIRNSMTAHTAKM